MTNLLCRGRLLSIAASCPCNTGAARVEASIPVTDLGVATTDATGGPLTLRPSGAAAASITIAVMRSE